MKREFLKDLGLNGDIIEKIMTEHGRTVTQLKGENAAFADKLKLDGIISSCGARDATVISALIGEKSADEAQKQIEGLKKTSPWLFADNKLPTFSAPADYPADDGLDCFRLGAGLKQAL